MKDIHIMIFILFLINLFSLIMCSFYGIQKISNNDNFLVLLDKGLYNYNYESKKCEIIKKLDDSIFEENDEYNRVVITKNSKIDSTETKIAVLINQHLYIYTYDNSSNNFKYTLINSLIDSEHKTFPFHVQIVDFKLTIYLLKHEMSFVLYNYFLKSFGFNNYLSIKNNEPKLIKYEDNFSNFPVCQLDTNSLNIKCIYVLAVYNYLKYIEFKNNEDSYVSITDNIIEGIGNVNYENINFVISSNKDFTCFSRNNETNCYYSANSKGNFQKISHNFENKCSEMKTYYFEENNQFILSCKKNFVYYIYIFNENNIKNNIQPKTFTLSDYNGKYDIIYNSKIDNYDIIYDDNFNEVCTESNNEEEELIVKTTNKIQENIQSTNINNVDTVKQDQSTASYNYLSEITKKSTIINIDETIKKETSTISYNYFSEIISDFPSYTNYSKFIYESFKRLEENIIQGNYNISEVEEGKGPFHSEKGVLTSFTTTYLQKIKEDAQYETSINLGQCETKLKEYYNISKESVLYILKMEIEQQFFEIPKIEYSVYYPLNNSKMEKLNLSLCEKDIIEISIPVNISEEDIEKYNPNSNYYNDICSKHTTENKTDITLKDRRKEFLEKNMTLCEDNCEFKTYDYNTKKVKCECDVKSFMSFIDEIKIDKNNLMKNFKKINNIANIKIIKCYQTVFKKENLIKNYGFYILIFILLTLFICIILFCSKYYQAVIDEINEIIKAKKNLAQKNEKIETRGQKNKISKKNQRQKNQIKVLI